MEFEKIIAPYSCHAFFTDYFESNSMHVSRGDNTYFENLLSIDDLDSVMAKNMLGINDCRLAKDGEIISFRDYTTQSGKRSLDQISIRKVSDFFSRGATVIFDHVHRWHSNLNLLTHKIHERLGCTAQCNVYLTPPSSQAFPAHFDTHDVFILQILGRKRWNIYPSAFELPLDKHACDVDPSTLKMEYEIDLQQGDTLYIPRGCVHEAISCDRTSLHVTVGLLTKTWSDFAIEVLEKCSNNHVCFRRSLLKTSSKSGMDDVDRNNQINEVIAKIKEEVYASVPTAETTMSVIHRMPESHYKGELVRALEKMQPAN